MRQGCQALGIIRMLFRLFPFFCFFSSVFADFSSHRRLALRAAAFTAADAHKRRPMGFLSGSDSGVAAFAAAAKAASD